MDFNKACLELEINSPFSLNDLKKQYRIMALKNHPDKHMPDIGNIYTSKFKQINIAYEYLIVFLEKNEASYNDNNSNMNDYNSLFNDFLSSVFTNYNYDIHNIISIIINDCQALSLSLFENMDKEKAIHIFEFINTYHHILYIPDNIVDKIKNIINDKIKNDNIIILNPSLDDILNDNVYMLDFEGEKYFVPLWHDELYYKHKSNDLIVKCIPDLPENISIHNDNLIIHIYHSIQNVLYKTHITYNIGPFTYNIPVDSLVIKTTQTYKIINRGFSIIQPNDIYDNGKKGDIIFIIHMK